MKGPGGTYGDLTVDNKGVLPGQSSELPSLGSGVAQTNSTGTTLVTNYAPAGMNPLWTSIPAYFEGHWVEIYESNGTTLKGTYQVMSVSGKTLTLSPGANVQVNDVYQGVYRFDTVNVKNGGALLSTDPIRAASSVLEGGTNGKVATLLSPVVVTGNVEVRGNVDARPSRSSRARRDRADPSVLRSR